MKKWTVALCLLSLSILLRLPYYFFGVINWDESTVILVAQSLLDGYLPYTELWDIKPPLIFVAYALFILVLGKSIIAIRFAGTLCVFLTSWFVYLIGNKLGNNSAGILAGVLSIIAASTLTGDAQTTLSEHVAVVPLLAGLTLLVTREMTLKILCGGGILLTVATMIRLNLAYTVVAVGIWLVCATKSKTVNIKGIVAYCLGSFSVIFLTYFPYLVTGNSLIWWNSVILAPLSYSQSEVQFDLLFKVCLAFAIAIGLWKLLKSEHQQQFVLLQVACLGTTISVIQGGEFHLHYLIQIFPFLSLTIALLWSKLPYKILRLFAIAWLTFKLSGYISPVVSQYYEVGDRLITGKSLPYGVTYEIADYLKRHNREKKPVYLMKDHIVYWLNDLQPLSKSATHPSNLAKEYLFPFIEGSSLSTEAELARILEQQPEFIVKKSPLSFVDRTPEIKTLLEQTLNSKYKLVKQIERHEIGQVSLIYQLKHVK